MSESLEINGHNRYRLLKALNELSDEELARVVNIDCKVCPFHVWCVEERYYVTCQNEIATMLRKDVK